MFSVTHGPEGDRLKLLTARSIASMAIARSNNVSDINKGEIHVVHFPPAIVSNPDSETFIICDLTSSAVFVAEGSRTRGRMPDHAARTSPLRT